MLTTKGLAKTTTAPLKRALRITWWRSRQNKEAMARRPYPKPRALEMHLSSPRVFSTKKRRSHPGVGTAETSLEEQGSIILRHLITKGWSLKNCPTHQTPHQPSSIRRTAQAPTPTRVWVLLATPARCVLRTYWVPMKTRSIPTRRQFKLKSRTAVPRWQKTTICHRQIRFRRELKMADLLKAGKL